MARAPKPFPHRGFWITTAGGKQVKLCPATEPESVAREKLAEFLAARKGSESPPALSAGATRNGNVTTLSEALDEYLTRHVPVYYRLPNGSPSREQEDIRFVLNRLSRRHGACDVSNLTRSTLKDFLGYLTKTRVFCKGRHSGRRVVMRPSRGVVNQRFGRVKRAFRWLAGEGLIPDALDAAVARIALLPAGRSVAPETEPVGAVSESTYRATLPRLKQPWRGLAELQWLTGMRPGEVVAVTRDLIVFADGRPVAVDFGRVHKMGYRGRVRVVRLGPDARALVTDRLAMADAKGCPYLFRSLRHGGRVLVRSYTNAVARACKAAGVDHWHPNQIRHSYATRVRARFGLDGAQVALGHARADVTQVYAETDSTRAATIADAMG